MTNVADGQLPSSAGSIYTVPPFSTNSGQALTRQVVVSLANTSSSLTETVTLTLKRVFAGGTVFRRVAQVVLAPNETALVQGVAMSPGDVLNGATTDAATVDYVVYTEATSQPFAVQCYDKNGALKQVNSGFSGNLAVSGSVLSTALGGIGYGTGTGVGGAVTQITSRTTGVTLNTNSGAITLVSAAGSATPFTFTVTNSQVAATDTVSVSQKSGTDAYSVVVSAVAAGSFKLTVTDLTGTTTEQPVINFNVFKGSAT